MADEHEEPDSTAVRVALWRAMHVEVDAAPHVLEDVVGLQLAAPDANWRDPARHASGRHHADSGPRSSPAPASSRISWPSRSPPASPSTSSSVPASTPSPSAGPSSAPPPDLRGRPARHPGVEASPPGGARLRRSRLAATGADRLRDRGELVGWADPPPASTPTDPRSSRRPASACTSPRRPPRRRCASSPRSRPARRVAMTFLLPAELRRRGRPTRARGQHPRRPASGHAVHQLLLARGDAGDWPATPASATSGTSRPERSSTATSRAAPTACARPAARN